MTYRLTKEADADLEKIYDYTFHQFGFHQANAYLELLIDNFKQLLKFPQWGVKRLDVYPKIRCLIVQSHLIFYEVLDEEILIVRVLHKSRDVIRYL